MTTLQRRPYKWHSISESFLGICNGQTPWVAIGNFLNDWWFFAIEHRSEMVEQPLSPATTLETQQWATFCAAMIEYLCQQEGLPFPEWTKQECYFLSNPWFLYERQSKRAWLMATTPAPFKMRNIYGGDRMFNHVPHR